MSVQEGLPAVHAPGRAGDGLSRAAGLPAARPNDRDGGEGHGRRRRAPPSPARAQRADHGKPQHHHGPGLRLGAIPMLILLRLAEGRSHETPRSAAPPPASLRHGACHPQRSQPRPRVRQERRLRCPPGEPQGWAGTTMAPSTGSGKAGGQSMLRTHRRVCAVDGSSLRNGVRPSWFRSPRRLRPPPQERGRRLRGVQAGPARQGPGVAGTVRVVDGFRLGRGWRWWGWFRFRAPVRLLWRRTGTQSSGGPL